MKGKSIRGIKIECGVYTCVYSNVVLTRCLHNKGIFKGYIFLCCVTTYKKNERLDLYNISTILGETSELILNLCVSYTPV